MDKQVLGYLAVLAFGFLGKVLWDWFNGGRVEKTAPYMTVKACEECRQRCCVADLKKSVAAHSQEAEGFKAQTEERLKSIDKRLDRGSEDFKAIMGEISEIKESLIRISTSFEAYIKAQELK